MSAALWSLFLSSFLASTLLPGGSEAVLIALAVNEAAPTGFLLLSATAGNTLGGLSSWLIGWWIRRRFPGVPLRGPRASRALATMERWGGIALLMAWLPIVGDTLCLAAGWLRINIAAAIFFIAVGKAARYAVLLIGLHGFL